ncbi:MAG TPA: hypothetical protein VNA29_08320 [Sphingomicrobium sp.]|nr:hypothetical protein [Sphingomicrobium sp.]
MIHFIPESPETVTEAQGPYAEAVARLASIREALACVEQFSGDEPGDCMAEAKLAAGWPVASPAHQRVYEARSARTAAAAAAGLEAIAGRKDAGGEPNPAAVARLKRELGEGIASVDQLFSL